MTKTMYIQLAPFKLKAGVDEATLLRASDEFEKVFVEKQKGVIKRVLMKGKDGNYADLVFFESKEEADRVAEEEQTSPVCHGLEFFTLTEMDEKLPEIGVLSFDHIKTYGKQD